MQTRTFRSDNNSGLCPEAMEAIHEAHDAAHLVGYGNDPFTGRAVGELQRIFGPETSAWFVATGTAANTLAIAALTRPWERVLCHTHSHLNADESTAPERVIGCRISAIDRERSKLTPDDLAPFAETGRGDVHEPQPGVLTISNPTEFGTVYTPQETRTLCEAAHRLGYRVHVDGARFANAVAFLGCDPCDLSINAGVDALSFGGTKNGLALGEAVLFFPQRDGSAFEHAVHAFPFLRKGTGHLLSKHRFVSAPFARVLAGGAWLRHAQHANNMAARLADGCIKAGRAPRFEVESNGVFVPLEAELHRALSGRGHEYYHPVGPRSWSLARLMCSFDTQAEEVDAFIADLEAAIASPSARP